MWFRSDVLKVMSNILIIFPYGNLLPNINAEFMKLKNIYDTQQFILGNVAKWSIMSYISY